MTVLQDREYQMGANAFANGEDRDEDESLDWLLGYDEAAADFEQ